MNISENTMQILKNYGSINPNFIARKGNTITTISEAKNILSSCTVEEQFEQDCGIYDLNEFLRMYYLLLINLNFRWKKNGLQIRDQTGRSKIKYFFTDPEMLTSPTEKMIENASNMDILTLVLPLIMTL